MKQSLQSFTAGRIGLDALISGLLNLRDSIDEVDPDWEQDFTQEVATLDSADQTTLEQRAVMGESLVHIVSEAVTHLSQLVEKPIAGLDLATVEA
jgi:hypothetical protein